MTFGSLYLTGGRQRRDASRRDEWHAFGRAVILEVDAASGAFRRSVEYVSPPEVCPAEDPSIIFKSGAIEGERLYVCTQTELLVYSLPALEVVDYVSLPQFNDVHHVAPAGAGRLAVANTGLDMVIELDVHGRAQAFHDVLGGDPWARFSRDIDYRRVPTTKPHLSHPNYVFTLDGAIWVTRFEERDAIALDDSGRRISIAVGNPHDGVVCDGTVYFTTVNGTVVAADAETLEVTRVVDLNDVVRSDAPLGWCRGIAVDGNRAWVGFTRLRPTRIQQNIGWVKSNVNWVRKGFQPQPRYDSLPTRISCFDLDALALVDEIELEPYGMNAVFGILPVGD